MKLNWIFIGVILLLIGSGCEKDESESVQVNGNINAIVNRFDIKDGILTPDSGRVEGTLSFLGTLKEGSYWVTENYSRHDNQNPPNIDYEMTGKLIAEKGDELFYNMEGKIYPSGNEDELGWIGTLTYTGGTGRFVNATGGGQTTGSLTYDEDIPVSVQINFTSTVTNVTE